MRFNNSKIIYSALLLISIGLTACGGGGSTTPSGGGGNNGTPTPVTLTDISITPATATVANGQIAHLTATGTYSDASTADITSQVSWATGNTSVATINSTTGVATGVAVGSTAVTASASGISSPTASLSVTAAVMTGLGISPTTPSTPKGTPVTFTATATYSDGSSGNVSGSVIWASSNTTVATLNGSGIASTLAQGSTTVTASVNGITSNSAALTVTSSVLTAIAITPINASVASGLNTNFTATGTYTDGTTADITSQVSWSSGNTSVATINPTTGVATGVAVGNTTVTATASGITSPTASLSVTAAVMTGISISPAAPSTPNGVPVTFTATATYSDGSSGNVSGSVTWASTNTTVATLNGSGIASSWAQGISTITASANGINSNSATLTVTAPALTAIAINSATASVAKGLTTNFTASGTYTNGTTANITSQVTWATANTSIATITTSGVATGVAVGATTVTATANGITSPTASLSVTAAVMTGISITPTAPAIPKGTPVTFTATASYSDGSSGNVSGSVTWASSNTTVATLNASGIASTLAQGSTTITASANGINSNSAILTVTAPMLTAIAINPTTAAVAKGLTTSFTANGTYTDGTTAGITSQVTWSSGNTGVATISTTGVATGVTVGSTTVTASANSITSPTASLSVTAAAITGISITPTAPAIPKGTPVTFTATASYSDGSSGNVSGSVTWASTNTTVATLNGSGIASTLAQGSCTITASANGISSNSATLTVTAPVLVALTITPSSAKVMVGNTQQFSASGTLTDGTAATLGTLTWSSSNTAVATIDGTGLATMVSIGSSSITVSSGGVSSNTVALSVIKLMGGAVQMAPLTLSQTVTFAGSSWVSGTTDGIGTGALFFYPLGITTDGNNLYVADTANKNIRKIVIATRVVTTMLVGASTSYPRGITTDGTNVYVADYNFNNISKIVISTGAATTLTGTGFAGAVDGISNVATFNGPSGITTDGTYLYVADTLNNKIRRVKISTGVVATIAGSSSFGATDGIATAATFYGPLGITTDGINLYVADTRNNKIRRIEIATFAVTTLAGSGIAGAVDGIGNVASFNNPTGISMDGTNLYVTDTGNNKIRRIVISTGAVTTLAGTGMLGAVDGTYTTATFNGPQGVTSDGSSLFVVDSTNDTIRKIQ